MGRPRKKKPEPKILAAFRLPQRTLDQLEELVLQDHARTKTEIVERAIRGLYWWHQLQDVRNAKRQL